MIEAWKIEKVERLVAGDEGYAGHVARLRWLLQNHVDEAEVRKTFSECIVNSIHVLQCEACRLLREQSFEEAKPRLADLYAEAQGLAGWSYGYPQPQPFFDGWWNTGVSADLVRAAREFCAEEFYRRKARREEEQYLKKLAAASTAAEPSTA
jgi:hypothetical protein